MDDATIRFTVDGIEIEAVAGQTVIEACDAAGIYIPRLCHHPDLAPAGQCRVCTCTINGRNGAACVTPAMQGMVVENETKPLNDDRRAIIEMLFVEGNHPCVYCVASGDCELQALGYRLGLDAPKQPYLWPGRPLDTTHPDIILDHDRCILCSRCIRASRMEDGKTVFGFEGRGIAMRLNVDAQGGLGETQMAAIDRAASVCPVACIVIKRDSYKVPNGKRRFDVSPIGSDIEAKRMPRT
ncbi:2Fe-2S iron-sulfur cluster binding domain-containing protein (plasmid) [Lichenicola cladoniae]|uniref:2Fe-2S iron-sulfur cluster binding domain-containing protein n=1 Tax=Lichenicola cladoniae TaxID=1484109 RepID=A0A6M8HZB7_9PROT|nr:2Fe-2S iron-sulfur cluster-binding protein [Lichenicola cladoniae]NPD68182.1 2Fe-2S iron-sulfur cluster binding domain-containing protein [Acetobacteraceae bacterium]QKE93567.1 2Fe-2S iron-sulfur cluster binding domain-containing protein [Lichenicola cladoniae]